jgi:hypothetical protein
MELVPLAVGEWACTTEERSDRRGMPISGCFHIGVSNMYDPWSF